MDLYAELVDLRDYPLPFFDSPFPPKRALPDDPQVQAWAAKVAEAVVRQAVSDGVARNPPENPAEAVATAMWDPAYPAIDVA